MTQEESPHYINDLQNRLNKKKAYLKDMKKTINVPIDKEKRLTYSEYIQELNESFDYAAIQLKSVVLLRIKMSNVGRDFIREIVRTRRGIYETKFIRAMLHELAFREATHPMKTRPPVSLTDKGMVDWLRNNS